MTAVTSDLTTLPLPHGRETVRARVWQWRQSPRALAAVAAALIVVMAATTAVALVRANDRGHRLAATSHELADAKATIAEVRASLATKETDLSSALTSLKDVQAELSDTKDENAALLSCVDSLLTFIEAAARGDLAAMRAAHAETNCLEVGDTTPTSAADGSSAASFA